MENQNPMSMTGHPRNRRAYATGQGDQEAEQRQEGKKHRDENRVPLLASALRLSPLQPASLSSQAHIWPWLPLAYLDSACFRRPCLRLFKRRPQPLALSACEQRTPDFVPPAHALPASIPAAVPRWVAWTCGSHTNFLPVPPLLAHEPSTCSAAWSFPPLSGVRAIYLAAARGAPALPGTRPSIRCPSAGPHRRDKTAVLLWRPLPGYLPILSPLIRMVT